MRYREFGKTGLQVSEIGFGCSRLGGVFAQSEDDTPIQVLRQALEAGINFYDTADMYSQGEAETLLGQAFRGQRNQVILATKGGYCLPTQRKLIARVKPLVKPLIKALGLKRENLPSSVSGSLSQDFSSAYLMQALENSLRRLQTDYLDFYQLHSPPTALIQSGEVLGILERMRHQGKIRFYGVAAESVADAALCLQYPTLASVQMPFGLLDLEALDGVLTHAADQRMGVIARGCFGGGLLKADLTEAQLQELTPKWLRILAYRQLAQEKGRPLLEMALQFALRAPAISVTLLGMRTKAHLKTNLRYYAAPPLSPADYEALLSCHP